MTERAALILAGGKAQRFQNRNGGWRNKALAELFGKPLLVHAVESVHDVVDEVVICVNNESRVEQYSKTLTEHHAKNVRFVVDENVSHIRGPNVAILTGLKAVEAKSCFILPCDVPLMQPKVADYLLNRVREDFHVVVPMWPNGRLETLIMAVKRDNVLEIVDTLCQMRRPRSDDIIRGALNVLLVSPLGQIRTLDPELKSFININSQEDLARLQTRQTQGQNSEDRQLKVGTLPLSKLQRLKNAAALYIEANFAEASTAFSSCANELEKEKTFFWAGLSRENEGASLMRLSQRQNDAKSAFLAAANDYSLETEKFETNQCMFLAERAKADRARCESLAEGKRDGAEQVPLR